MPHFGYIHIYWQRLGRPTPSDFFARAELQNMTDAFRVLGFTL